MMLRMYSPPRFARTYPTALAAIVAVVTMTYTLPAHAQDQAHGRAQQPRAHARSTVSDQHTQVQTQAQRDSDVIARAAPPATTGTSVIEMATREYRERGVARTVAIGNAVVYPYGHSDPVLTCTVLRVCVVELEDSEQIVSEPIAGDQARWIIQSAPVGPGGRNMLVAVKPKACDITTNLVIPTDRRIYDLTLDSPACNSRSTNPKDTYVRDIRFYYPDGDESLDADSRTSAVASVIGPTSRGTRGSLALASAAMQTDGPRAHRGRDDGSASAPLSFFDRADLNHDYRVRRERRGPFGLFGQKPLDFPWKPTAIVDDGAHVYVRLPLEATSHAAPVLYALEDDGSRTMVNYAVREADGVPTYVTDRVFHRGLFVVMSGAREQRLEFDNTAWDKLHPAADVRNVVAEKAARGDTPDRGTR